MGGLEGLSLAGQTGYLRASIGRAELKADYVLPRIGRVKLVDIIKTVGIFKGNASDVRAGKFTPHVSTWPALAEPVHVELPPVEY